MIRHRHSLQRSARFPWIGLALGLCLCALTAPAPLIPDVQTQTTKWSREWLRQNDATNAGQLLSSIPVTNIVAAGQVSWLLDTNQYQNVIIGYQAGQNAGDMEIFGFGCATLIGYRAGMNASNSLRPTMIGFESGWHAYAADNATFLGVATGQYATNSDRATFLGYSAGRYSHNSVDSTHVGTFSGRYVTNGHGNVFIGSYSGWIATNCQRTILIGAGAGQYNPTVTNSILIANPTNASDIASGPTLVDDNNKTVIGNPLTQTALLYGNHILVAQSAPTVSGTDIALWNSNGTLFAVSASATNQLLP